MTEYEQIANEFYPYAKQYLGFDKDVKINFLDDEYNATDSMGRTGYFDPVRAEIVIFVTNRHPKDILRSLAHELVHFAQRCDGRFPKDFSPSEGYAQKDPQLRALEQEAYTIGNMCFRDWEDQRREKPMDNVALHEAVIPSPELKKPAAELPQDKPLSAAEKNEDADEDEGKRIKTIRKIISSKTAGKIEGRTIDLFTASVLNTIYNAFKKPESREKFETMALEKLVFFAYRQLQEGKKRARETTSLKGEQLMMTEKKEKKWIQKAVDPEHKGYCTPMSKPTCTPKRKALAKRFKAMAKKKVTKENIERAIVRHITEAVARQLREYEDSGRGGYVFDPDRYVDQYYGDTTDLPDELDVTDLEDQESTCMNEAGEPCMPGDDSCVDAEGNPCEATEEDPFELQTQRKRGEQLYESLKQRCVK
jgi:hypothetical protein